MCICAASQFATLLRPSEPFGTWCPLVDLKEHYRTERSCGRAEIEFYTRYEDDPLCRGFIAQKEDKLKLGCSLGSSHAMQHLL